MRANQSDKTYIRWRKRVEARSGTSSKHAKLSDKTAQIGILGLGKKGIQTATVIDSAQRGRRNPELKRLAQRFRDQRDVVQVGQETTLGLVIRVADIVADHRALTGKFAAA